ncbi:unnamed protein product [Nippostrongylus brasiliensis]|uniref:BAG domain-containing protein n=1 Tax=Nippostrongylus brasiliensis TaxID=27835 RepID=A0A0N4Y3E8_NIPBR|nr:unnamed protein product [Nippostrongylus brasiliensis]
MHGKKIVRNRKGNLSKRSSRGGERELEETYEKMEQKRRLAALRKAKPMMNAVEIYLAQLHEWLDSPDAYDRAKALDVLDQVGKTIDAIDAEAATSHVDCEGYRRALQMCTSRLHGEGTSANQPVEEPPVDKEYVREVMSRAELILSRRETNEDEVRSSVNDMADCEIVLNDWKSRRLAVVRERWEAKKAEFELWRLYMDRVQQIATELDQQRGYIPGYIPPEKL